MKYAGQAEQPGMIISSPNNDQIKSAAKLRGRRARIREKKTLIEGNRALKRALDASFPLDKCFFCRSLFTSRDDYTLLKRLELSGAGLLEVSENMLRKLAYRDSPEAFIGVAAYQIPGINSIKPRVPGLLLVAESIEKPGNLGSMLRSADAAGVDGMILCGKGTDLFNPNVIRASTGTVFSMPVAEAECTECLSWLKKQGFQTVAAAPSANIPYAELDMTAPTAIVVGAEENGLSEFWMRNSQFKVKIPMLGAADSLNVSISASIILFEAARQRKNTGLVKTHSLANRGIQCKKSSV